ncbi:MAG: DNA mismatch repair endonuclease MutL [Nodosilinea sp.]
MEVVDHISAGEVIDSLAAAVRELVDNALDARATSITVSLWPEQWRVQVADNGIGMACSDLVMAATPHSTSKIRSQHDLSQVASLGFRGQALHSLAQVGQLTICSRPPHQKAGWRVAYSEQGQAAQVEPVAIAPGTVVTVTNLFIDWPSRRQRLPTPARQLRDIQRVIYHSALCHPTVTWAVQTSDRPWLRLNPGATALVLVPQMLRPVATSDLREGDWPQDRSNPPMDQAKTALYALVGLPDRCHRPRPDWVKVGVNGRLVALPELEQGIIQAFRHTLPRHRFPLCFLHLTVPPSHIDWTRSPDKAQLYLHDLEPWIAQCQAHISALLGQHSPALHDPSHPGRITQLLKTAEPGGDYGASMVLMDLSDALPNPGGTGSLRAIAQVHNRYILAEQPDGLCLIEQHIAHERVLYERLQAQWQVVPLGQPVVLEHLTPDQVEQLQQLGLTVDDFGPHRWAIRSAPAPLAQRDDLPAALLELSRGGNLAAAQVAVACRTAIRNGTPLSLTAMQALLEDWQRTQHPRTCPHGRPICLTLKETSLARFFRRHWVVGKSHGLEPGAF